MAVGTMRAVVIDVDDLAVGERFWSAVTGKPVRFSGWGGQFSRLGAAGDGSILLQLVPDRKTTEKNRVHVDITVDDLTAAVEDVLALGGTLRKGPSHDPFEEPPVLEWAVMADPFGNELCLIRELPHREVAE